MMVTRKKETGHNVPVVAMTGEGHVIYATQPSSLLPSPPLHSDHHLRYLLQSPPLPWNITVEPPHTPSPNGAKYISTQDVLDVLYTNMRTPVKQAAELKALTPDMSRASLLRSRRDGKLWQGLLWTGRKPRA